MRVTVWMALFSLPLVSYFRPGEYHIELQYVMYGRTVLTYSCLMSQHLVPHVEPLRICKACIAFVAFVSMYSQCGVHVRWLSSITPRCFTAPLGMIVWPSSSRGASVAWWPGL